MTVAIELAGETALVTGGGSGIGRRTALLLAEAGADVVVLDLDQGAATAVAEEVQALGRHATPVAADVTDAGAVGAGLAASGAAAPTVLVNNAFWAAPGPFLQADPAADEKTLAVILGGTMSVTRLLLPAMVAAGRGCVVSIMSEAGRVGEPGMVAYSAAKAGVGGFTRALAKEVGPRGVRVNAVSPGATRTPAMTAATDGDTLRRMGRAYPLRRLGEVEDIAQAVVWLASPLASWVTGQVLSVSGGYTML